MQVATLNNWPAMSQVGARAYRPEIDLADQFGFAGLGVRKGTLVGEGGSKKNRCASK
jgi:hypothetical protein